MEIVGGLTEPAYRKEYCFTLLLTVLNMGLCAEVEDLDPGHNLTLGRMCR